MSETNKSYRIRTNIDSGDGYITLDANLVQEYDAFDIMSVTLKSVDTYRLHNADYGVVVGRVLANNGFGVPNAKISIFIARDDEDETTSTSIYSYISTYSRGSDGIRYNLLPDEQVSDCHQVVGTFPNKRYLLDNDEIIEVFDKYYKYTTKSNNSGDYMIMGVPTGTHTLHMDLDLSDCGILSQKPRDFVYKGYTIEQFENPNKFKDGTEYSSLSQVFTQDQVITVQPFWGNESLGETIGITRADINVSFKFEPTCVFIGGVVSDNSSQGISKKCIPTEHMGDMDELTTGEGRIEMIRKTLGGSVEEFSIKGTQLINENGIWCYQIPMNLDYMMTDEYGNMVPTDDPDKGIPTRARVRFRFSMQDNEGNVDNYFRPKILVPNNPQVTDNGNEGYDYEFGSKTNEESYRDLFWNNVYSTKSYIPRFQKTKVKAWEEDKFTGIKHCNHYGANNPIPYNNIRIKLPFLYKIICAIVNTFIKVVSITNYIISEIGVGLADVGNTNISLTKNGGWYPLKRLYAAAKNMRLVVLQEGLCPDLENWFFAPVTTGKVKHLNDKNKEKVPKDFRNAKEYNILEQTYDYLNDGLKIYDKDGRVTAIEKNEDTDPQSIDNLNTDKEDNSVCLTTKTDYLVHCIEMRLADEYKVVNFDFYNDWINGMLYFPRFMRISKAKKKFMGITWSKARVKGCMDNTKIFAKTRRYTQMCALPYSEKKDNGLVSYTSVSVPKGMGKATVIKANNKMHKKKGLSQQTIFGKNGGVCHEHTTLKGQYVYYLKPCEWTKEGNGKVNLFATDLILLGSLNDCDINGIPQAFKHLSSTSYIMPSNLAQTNMETNGPLYSTPDETFCGGNGAQTEYNEERIRQGVKVVSNMTSNLSKELSYYNGGGIEASYDGDEDSDTIAITEAAGISWDWPGPGQETDKSLMYYPGGHFLGLSCANSETNMKSCINLSRICEVGSSMSQRKEEPRMVTVDGELKYRYTVPTGFISQDDIIDGDFRTMFATMNQNRLIATKTNPETGYKSYDFAFLKPNGFDGAFNDMATRGSSKYNNKVEVEEESSLLDIFGIGEGKNRNDYDDDETAYTQTRTIENRNVDYYRFRMGLGYENMTEKDNKHIGKFLKRDGKTRYLPQYENSFYFYFGMKQGATALDEFNKQFFSECEKTSLEMANPSLTLTSDVNWDNGDMTINALIENMAQPYAYVKYQYSGVSSTLTDLDGTDVIVISGLSVTNGEHTVTVKDADGVEITKSINPLKEKLSCDVLIHDFNTTDGSKSKNEYRGGYVEIFNIKGIEYEEAPYKLGEESTGMLSIYENNVIYVNSANVIYTLYVKYGNIYVPMTSFVLKDSSSVQLCVGSKNLLSLPVNGNTTTSSNWWEGSTNVMKATSSDDSVEKWLYRILTFNEGIDDFHSCKIFASGGTKAVWATPQNTEGFCEDKSIKCSEMPMDIPNGYYVDDETVYHSTWPPVDNVKQFYACAYNEGNISGDYAAIITDGSIDSSNLAEGSACVVKDLDTEEISFEVYPPVVSGITNGLIYPTFKYPVIDKPFSAAVTFVEWDYYQLVESSNIYGDADYSLESSVMRANYEGEIYNGITYGWNFGSGTNINGDESPTIVVSNPDTDDNRVAKISPKYYLNNDSASYNFEIEEGYPSESGQSMINSIVGTVTPQFYDTVKYYDDNGNVGLKFEGDTDENVRYYKCMRRSNSKLVSGKKYYAYESEGDGNGSFVFLKDTQYGTTCLGALLGNASIIPFTATLANANYYPAMTIEMISGVTEGRYVPIEGMAVDETYTSSWVDEVMADKNNTYQTAMATQDFADNGYVIGDYSAETQNGIIRVIHIYPQVARITKPIVTVDTTSLQVVESCYTAGLSECFITVTVKGAAGRKWVCSALTASGPFYDVSPTTGVGETLVSVHLKEDCTPGTINIVFSYENDDKTATLTINRKSEFKQLSYAMDTVYRSISVENGESAETIMLSSSLFNNMPKGKSLNIHFPAITISDYEYIGTPYAKIAYVIYKDGVEVARAENEMNDGLFKDFTARMTAEENKLYTLKMEYVVKAEGDTSEDTGTPKTAFNFITGSSGYYEYAG